MKWAPDLLSIQLPIHHSSGATVPFCSSCSLISGAMHPHCKICIFMGKTDPKASTHSQQSMILVPMDTPGIKILRALSVYGFEDPPGNVGIFSSFCKSKVWIFVSESNIYIANV